MKTAGEINDDVIQVTMKIAEAFPELLKFMDEMLCKYGETSGPGINIKSLDDYCNSLDEMLSNYMIYGSTDSNSISFRRTSPE